MVLRVEHYLYDIPVLESEPFVLALHCPIHFSIVMTVDT
jgi:hypothetical protein